MLHVKLLKMLGNSSNNSCNLESMGKPSGQKNVFRSAIHSEPSCYQDDFCCHTVPAVSGLNYLNRQQEPTNISGGWEQGCLWWALSSEQEAQTNVTPLLLVSLPRSKTAPGCEPCCWWGHPFSTGPLRGDWHCITYQQPVSPRREQKKHPKGGGCRFIWALGRLCTAHWPCTKTTAGLDYPST